MAAVMKYEMVDAVAAMRKMADASGYGRFISDDTLKSYVYAALMAAATAREAHAHVPAPEPPKPDLPPMPRG